MELANAKPETRVSRSADQAAFIEVQTDPFLRRHPLRRPEFTYSEHPLTEEEIRVIEIHPGLRGDRLSCSLKTIQRSGEIPYSALSYVWGYDAGKGRILVNGKEFWITSNLRDALCRVRQKNWNFWLWIDAIA